MFVYADDTQTSGPAAKPLAVCMGGCVVWCGGGHYHHRRHFHGHYDREDDDDRDDDDDYDDAAAGACVQGLRALRPAADDS